MKKLWILSVAMVLFAGTVHAQSADLGVNKKQIRKEKRQALKKLPGTGISVEVKQAFAGDFGNVPVAWERTDILDKASFTSNGTDMTAYYDADAQLIGTVINKSFADLPAKAQQTINSQYADYKKGTVIFFDDNERNETDMVLYGLQFDDIDCYFIELSKDSNTLVLQITMNGQVADFTTKHQYTETRYHKK
ncbi:hypothetical protein ACTHGU_10550 [Chitinophagaceae bacterium MMS25-I14]